MPSWLACTLACSPGHSCLCGVDTTRYHPVKLMKSIADLLVRLCVAKSVWGEVDLVVVSVNGIGGMQCVC